MTESLYDIPLQRIDGTPATLGEYRGKVLLIVNVASACGLTPQYTALQHLYTELQAAGLVIAAFPANDFGAQEPGSNHEIAEFCSRKFAVTFPMFEKISVKGVGQHALYRLLTTAQPEARQKPGSSFRAQLASHDFSPAQPNDILWNFEKFLVDRNGNVCARFAPDVTPDDAPLRAAIDAALRG